MSLKKIFSVLLLTLVVFIFPVFSQIQYQEKQEDYTSSVFCKEKEKVPVEIFVRPGCSHCEKLKNFLLELSLNRDDFSVKFHDIEKLEYYDHFLQLTELEKIPKVTPITLVGNTIIEGFDSSKTTGKRIEEIIGKSIGKKTLNFEEFLAAGGSGKIESFENAVCSDEVGICQFTESQDLTSMEITVPFFGITDLKKYSLLSLSVILGFIDGFNPCAIWVLVTFLIILAQLGSKKKMWQITGIFILAESIMYFLILNVWFTTWDFVGLDKIITPIVGLVSIGGGIFFLYEWKNSDGTCKVTNPEQKKKISKRIKDLIKREMSFLTFFGIVGLALSVNVIEFACSIGIPQSFSKILEINDLSFWKNQFFMMIYVLFYMIDDFIVFGIAIYSFEKIGMTTKYTKISNLIGGILMIILGIILIFKRDLLIF